MNKKKTYQRIGKFGVVSLGLLVLFLIVDSFFSIEERIPEWLTIAMVVYYFPGGVATWLIAIGWDES